MVVPGPSVGMTGMSHPCSQTGSKPPDCRCTAPLERRISLPHALGQGLDRFHPAGCDTALDAGATSRFWMPFLASESGRRFWIARLRPARPRHPKSHPCCVSRHSGPRPLQQQRPRTRLPDAYAASHSPILSNPFVASVYASCGQVLGDFIARPKEDLIRGLPLECGVRHHFVVCGDVKLGESTKIGEAVQRIEGIAKSASEIARMPRSSNWKT
jgi:hypothetical protein